MALFTIQKSYNSIRVINSVAKNALQQTCINTHKEKHTHFPFVKNANKANWLIISPTCIYHYLVWSSLSISPSTLMPHPSFRTLSQIFSFIFSYCQLHETLKPRQILIINHWLLQRAVQLKKEKKKKRDYNNPRESFKWNQLHSYKLSHSWKKPPKSWRIADFLRRLNPGPSDSDWWKEVKGKESPSRGPSDNGSDL